MALSVVENVLTLVRDLQRQSAEAERLLAQQTGALEVAVEHLRELRDVSMDSPLLNAAYRSLAAAVEAFRQDVATLRDTSSIVVFFKDPLLVQKVQGAMDLVTQRAGDLMNIAAQTIRLSASALMQDSEAALFWRRHFGDECNMVNWRRLFLPAVSQTFPQQVSVALGDVRLFAELLLGANGVPPVGDAGMQTAEVTPYMVNSFTSCLFKQSFSEALQEAGRVIALPYFWGLLNAEEETELCDANGAGAFFVFLEASDTGATDAPAAYSPDSVGNLRLTRVEANGTTVTKRVLFRKPAQLSEDGVPKWYVRKGGPYYDSIEALVTDNSSKYVSAVVRPTAAAFGQASNGEGGDSTEGDLYGVDADDSTTGMSPTPGRAALAVSAPAPASDVAATSKKESETAAVAAITATATQVPTHAAAVQATLVSAAAPSSAATSGSEVVRQGYLTLCRRMMKLELRKARLIKLLRVPAERGGGAELVIAKPSNGETVQTLYLVAGGTEVDDHFSASGSGKCKFRILCEQGGVELLFEAQSVDERAQWTAALRETL